MKKLIFVLLASGMLSNLLGKCHITCLDYSDRQYGRDINKPLHSMTLEEVKMFCRGKGFKTFSIIDNTCIAD